MKEIKKSSKKSYNISTSWPKYGHFWPSYRQKGNKKSVGNRFLKFWLFPDFWAFFGQIFGIFPDFGPKNTTKSRKNFFFIIFPILFHTNTSKTARRPQLHNIITRQQIKLFQFGKKFLKPHNPNFEIC